MSSPCILLLFPSISFFGFLFFIFYYDYCFFGKRAIYAALLLRKGLPKKNQK